ncbi:MAG: hypothetical protein HONBIEJF_01578 [Fimbriimonadaceae bacterium]|nr:hypothetical protein [Fimbriimonadaceae bacterium]
MVSVLLAISLVRDPVLPALPEVRHGHRLERYGKGWITFGGYGRTSAADRGMRDVRLTSGTGVWSPGPSLPEGRTFFGSVEWRGNVYAIGGGVDVLKAAARSWQKLNTGGDLPETHLAAARLGSRAYALGGYPAELGSFRSIDLESGRVRVEPAMPGYKAADHFFILVNLSGKLHAIGGLSAEDFEPTKRHGIFDGKTWSKGPPPPKALWAKFSAVAVSGSQVWILGKEASVSYNSTTRRWKELPLMPGSVAMPTAAVVDGKIVVLGGQAESGPDRPIRWVYDPIANRWDRGG